MVEEDKTSETVMEVVRDREGGGEEWSSVFRV